MDGGKHSAAVSFGVGIDINGKRAVTAFTVRRWHVGLGCRRRYIDLRGYIDLLVVAARTVSAGVARPNTVWAAPSRTCGVVTGSCAVGGQ